MGSMGPILLVVLLALSLALSNAEEVYALGADDECLADGDGGGCALSALQHRGSRLKGTAAASSSAVPPVATTAAPGAGLGEASGNREFRDKHALNLLDRADYRADAAVFLEEALRSEDASAMCDLAPMSYAEVLRKWSDFHAEWMSKLPRDVPSGARRLLSDHIRQAFPEVLFQGNPVVVKNAIKDIGWNPDNWRQDELKDKLGGLQLREMMFGYPAWLSDSIGMGMGADHGHPKTSSFAEYFEKNKSKDDIFLFLNEEMPSEEPRMVLESENEAAYRLRNILTPTPPFAFPSKARLALVAIDGQGSSHGFHSHTAVWQVQVHGHKMWHFMPPSTPFSFGVHERGGTPLVKGKPFSHPNGCAFLNKVATPPGSTKCLVGPGDMIIMPANWVHSTCGLTEYTAAAGGWLHAGQHNRDGEPLQYLEGILAEILDRQHAESWLEEDFGLHRLTDEEEERRAGLSPETAQLDRMLHPADFDPAIGRG